MTKMFALAGMGVLAQGLVPNLCNIDPEKRPEAIRSRDRITLSDSPWSASSAQVSAQLAPDPVHHGEG
jgi:hypothetical protein